MSACLDVCVCTSSVSQSPLVKITYTSKRLTKVYKSGQGLELKTDFDAAQPPVESEGYCSRELTSLANVLNARSDMCGRVAQIAAGVGFVIQIEFVESSPEPTTNWSWYLGLPFRAGSGGIVMLDGRIVQEFLGVAMCWGGVLAKAIKVDTPLSPGPHVLQIYGQSQSFESSSVLFSRDASAPIVASVSAIASELLKWVSLSTADPTVAAVAQKERAPKTGDVARGVSTLQLQRLSTDAQFAVRLRSVVNANCKFTDSFNSSSRMAIAYLPTTSAASARSTELATPVTPKNKWDVLPGLATATIARTGPGVLLCAFTGRLFADDTIAKSFSLDLAFAVSRSAFTTTVLTPQHHLDSSFIQPSSAALDFSAFIDVSDISASTNVNVSLSYLFTAAKSVKIVGGRISVAFLPGASLLSVVVQVSSVASLSTNVFTRDVQLAVPSTLIVRATAVICRNAASETLTARIFKSGSVLFDSVFSSASNVAPAGTCEPMVMHAVVDAAVGVHKIALDVATTSKASTLR